VQEVDLIRNSLNLPTCDMVFENVGKVIKRGAFQNDNSAFKLLYLRVVELQKSELFASSPIGVRKTISYS